MAGFAGIDDFIEEMTVNEKILEAEFNKISGLATLTDGAWFSLWKDGPMPPAGSDPATTPGTAYDNDNGGLSVGAWGDQDPDQKYLVSFSGVCQSAYTLLLYDRLVGVSGISLASTGNKTISSAALPRYTDGVGVQAWLEVTTAIATTAPVVTLNSYTDDDGNTGQSGASLTLATDSRTSRSFGPLPIAAGDQGIRAVSTLNVGTAASAGVVNFLLIKPLAILPVSRAGQGASFDFFTMLPIMPRIYDGATLGLLLLSATGTTARIHGQLRGVYG